MTLFVFVRVAAIENLLKGNHFFNVSVVLYINKNYFSLSLSFCFLQNAATQIRMLQ